MPLTQVKTSNLDTTNSLFFRNRIINGAMTIDQRNAGASVTISSGSSYTLDRWNFEIAQSSKISVQRNAGSVTPPPGFTNYLGITSLSAYSVLSGDYFSVRQLIEGLNISDLAWGTASAKTVTISFWVRSSLTGTFGGAIKNGDSDYNYPFSYTITSSNTWEQKKITIAGPTSGTWYTTATAGLQLYIGLGTGSQYGNGTAGAWTTSNFITVSGATSVVGTNGATFYITGVQLEVGTAATAFEYRPFTTELQLCQRYYEKSYDIGVVPGTNAVNGYIISPTGTNTVVNNVVFNGPSYKVNKRISSPTIVIYGYSGGTSRVSGASTGADLAASSGILNSTGESTFSVYNNSGSTLTTNSLGVIYHFTSSAEL
jgi:hypothetical protein